MKIVKQSWGFEEPVHGLEIIKKIEKAGRTCYKSEDKITDMSAVMFCKSMLKSGHHSVIEHHNITVRIITDRGVTHEIVRHRLASYSQESTRYCNYSKGESGGEITVIMPVWFYDCKTDHIVKMIKNQSFDIPEDADPNDFKFMSWYAAMTASEASYMGLIQLGQTAQEARSVLPNSLKTELVMTCNIREWRHFFKLRCAKAAHPQMRELAQSMHQGFKDVVPILFDDITY